MKALKTVLKLMLAGLTAIAVLSILLSVYSLTPDASFSAE